MKSQGAVTVASTLKSISRRPEVAGPQRRRRHVSAVSYVFRCLIDGDVPVAQRAFVTRERTLAHVTLPAEEQFTVEYVTNKSWSGYNWYQGSYKSLIQVNTDLPIYIDRAIDLACHEGVRLSFPNALLESISSRSRLIEFMVIRSSRRSRHPKAPPMDRGVPATTGCLRREQAFRWPA
jgi:hypothetical protein